MRGKSIWFMALILSVALTSTVIAQWEPDAAKMLVEPTVSVANPTETFWVDINIEKVIDLYAFEFKLGYTIGTKVIGAVTAEEGGFLTGPEGTAFAFDVAKIAGYVYVGGTILGFYPGVTGSGTLARIQFVVAESGESPLHLYAIKLLDSNLNEMIAQTRDGYFDGSNVELVRVQLGSRVQTVGDIQTFDTKIINEGTVPLDARVRIDNVRVEDGQTKTFWSGQQFSTAPPRAAEYKYVNGFDNTRIAWTTYGTSPWLNAVGDGNYIEGTTNTKQMRFFEFEDIDLSDGADIDKVTLEGYTAGPYNEGVDFDIYASDFTWLGSLYANGAYQWVTPRWLNPGETLDITYPVIKTLTGFNSFKILTYFYDPGGFGGAGNLIDCIRLKVEFMPPVKPATPPIYKIQPGEVLTLELAKWILRPENVGTWTTTVTVYYKYGPKYYNAGEKKVITRTWWVKA